MKHFIGLQLWNRQLASAHLSARRKHPLMLALCLSLMWSLSQANCWAQTISSQAFGPKGIIGDVAFSPQGSLLAMTIQPNGRDWMGTQVWDWKAGRLLWSNGDTFGWKFSPDGQLLACEEKKNQRVMIREARTGNVRTVIQWPHAHGPRAAIRNVLMNFSANSQTLFALTRRDTMSATPPKRIESSTVTLMAYSVTTGKVVRTLTLPWLHATTSAHFAKQPTSGRFRAVDGFDVAPDGQTVIVTLSLWEAHGSSEMTEMIEQQVWTGSWSGQLSRPFRGVETNAALFFSANSAVMASWDISAETSTPIQLWNLRTGALLQKIKISNLLTAPVLSPDGKSVVLCAVAPQKPNVMEISIRNTMTGQVEKRIAASTTPNALKISLTLSGDGTTLAVAPFDPMGSGTQVQLWHLNGPAPR